MGVIETIGLTRRYGTLAAVSGLDLRVRQGSVTGFLGPNGAGKTTTLRMLLGLVNPTSGTVRICGHVVKPGRGAPPSQVAALIEGPTFYGALSARDNLRLLTETAGLRVSQNLLDGILERVGLTGRGHELVRGFSLGMKQRLGVASVLIHSPQVLILDEPTNGLDPQGQADMRSLLASLPGEGRTVFVSSHLLKDVEHMCTDLVILDQGRKVVEGRLTELLQKGHRLSLRVDDVARARQVLQQHRPQLSLVPDTELDVELPAGAASDSVTADVVSVLVGARIGIYGVSSQAANLERLFLDLTSPRPSR